MQEAQNSVPSFICHKFTTNFGLKTHYNNSIQSKYRGRFIVNCIHSYLILIIKQCHKVQSIFQFPKNKKLTFMGTVDWRNKDVCDGHISNKDSKQASGSQSRLITVKHLPKWTAANHKFINIFFFTVYRESDIPLKSLGNLFLSNINVVEAWG